MIFCDVLSECGHSPTTKHGNFTKSRVTRRGPRQNVFVCPSRSGMFFLFTVRLMFDDTTKPQQRTNKSPREELPERLASESNCLRANIGAELGPGRYPSHHSHTLLPRPCTPRCLSLRHKFYINRKLQSTST
jgi:hypothetical protein